VNTRIIAEAEAELSDAITHYEEIEPGLGLRLREEARAAIAWIGEYPLGPRLRPKGYRRVNLRIFRYYVAYAVLNETIWVLAITHGRRRPEYWIERKDKAQ
jgi:plasmid stabilization system protein ParE